MKRNIMLIAMTLLLIPALLFGATEKKSTRYDLGSQMFSFKAGPTVPLFFAFPYQSNPITGFGPDGTHLDVGGYGSISYQAFVNPYIALGGEIGYSFAYSKSNSLYTMVPIQAKVTFLPVQGVVDLPISLGFGGAYNSYNDSSINYSGSYFSMFASFEIGLSWFFTDNWGVGINCGYWLVPEIYTTAAMKDQTALGNIMPITLSVTYRN